MKKTRNLFVLTGNVSDIHLALANIQFKGITILHENEVTSLNISTIFNNNRSVVCPYVFNYEFNNSAIFIDIVNTSADTSNPNSININTGNISIQFQQIANNHLCDIGDHKSNSSGITNKSNILDCVYCKYINGFSSLDTGFVLYQSENFFVTPTVGEFVKGYLLIIPKAHIMSMAEDISLLDEFISVLFDIQDILKLTYNVNNFLVWENGTGNSGIGKAKNSIVHAHVHIAPSLLDIEKIKKISLFPMKPISLKNLSNYKNHSYLLVKGNNNLWNINDNSNLYIPRQFIRQLLADEYNIPNECWNWRNYPYHELRQETCKDIRNALKNNWNYLPHSIKQNTVDFL